MPTASKQNLISIINPSTEEKISELVISSESEIKEKVRKARDAFEIWSNIGIEKRVNHLQKIYDIIINDRENIAKIITKNNGKPLAESYLTEIASTLQVMEHFIKKGPSLISKKNISLGPLYPTKNSFITYEPIGTVAIIKPWNYPFYLPFSAITKTLLAGNTFVLKPSSTVSLVGKLIEDILAKAGLPDGVANVIYGDGTVAEKLIENNIDKVIFTGSIEIGKNIAEVCAKRLIPVSLELGGKDPAIVLNDCNLDYAAGGIMWGALSNCGQACASIERVYVQSEIHDDFIEKIISLVKELKIGDGFDDETDIGPVINNEQIKKIEEQVDDAISKGARLHMGGKRIERKGFFLEPAVLSNVNHSMKIMREETFGPVIPIMKFETIDEVIKLANDTRYGSSGSIWCQDTSNVSNIANKLNCGTVWVNDSLFLQAHPNCPWQGYKESGYGSSTVYDFVKAKHISIDKGYLPSIRPKSFWWYPYKGKASSFSDFIELIYKSGIKEKAKAIFETFISILR